MGEEDENGNASRMRVVVRIRPINARELANNEATIIEQLDEKTLVFDPANEDVEEHLRDFHKVAKLAERGAARGGAARGMRRKRNAMYVFDGVFGPNTTQEHVYQETTADTVDTVMRGYNCTVFAYGATGAGKTHTMLGTRDSPGVIARTVADLYEKVDEAREANPGTRYDVEVEYLEVYNEKINDLLVANMSDETGKKRQPGKNLPLREVSSGVLIAGLTKKTPQNADDLMEMLSDGNGRRTQHPTDANAQSSRSHAVFTVTLTAKEASGNSIVKSKLTLVDLAGSERATATTNQGARLREGANINKSLLALGNVINALADSKHKGHIKYRDSKLTRLLKDSLGGTCRTVMIANVSPAMSVYEDTLNTIKYADRAKSIRSDLKKRVIERELHVGRYKEIITNQKRQIASLQEELRDMRRASAKPKPNRGDNDDINPIWDTLLKVVLNVTRIKGDMKVTQLDRFVKEKTFDLRGLTCDIGESPGTDRAKRTLDGYDAKHSRQLDQVNNLEKQVKSLAPTEATPPLINWRRCAEHHQQRSESYEEQVGKLYKMANQQHDIIQKLAESCDKEVVREVLNPSDNMTVRFNFVNANDMGESAVKESIPDFLRIPVGEEADLLRPLSASGSQKQETVTRSALRKTRREFSTARRPLHFSKVKTPEEKRQKRTTPESGRKLAKSSSLTSLKRGSKESSTTTSRPRTAEPPAVKKHKENILPPSEKRRLEELKEKARKRKSDGHEDEDSPEQPSKKTKTLPSYMQPTAISKRRNGIHQFKEEKKLGSSKERLRILKEKLKR